LTSSKQKMIILLFILIIVVAAGMAYLRQPQFGANAKGKRLQRLQASPNFKNGSFVNRSPTPVLTEGFSQTGVVYDFLFRRSARTKPRGAIPSVPADPARLPAGDWILWLGHSSYLIQADGLRILVDPVLSGAASPIPRSNRAFRGIDPYRVEDLSSIDYLLITHDHYDHLDYKTVVKLRERVRKVVCGLGVGAHLERWGYPPESITELDWDTELTPEEGLRIFGLTARHFSGRAFKRNSTLWMSFLLQTPTRKIYIGGDSGYDRHFREIGELHGPIDLAILENGQYNEAWKVIHFMPGENLQAAIDLKAKRLMPVHSGKFAMAMHDWDEPLNELVRRNKELGLPLVTPRIGELVNLNDASQVFTEWWRAVDETIE
jgi:L-ascorbate metabolism protein UlaG (beta-lactamase superfamily)